jgi:sec-independent protein translocase protein TatB
VFDISFSELLVIAIVALVVIGPEKLPKVARTAGAFFGRLQRFVAQVKDEVNRESRFAELQKLQDEVHSSLQQSYVDIERSILPTDSQVTEAQSTEAQVTEAQVTEAQMLEQPPETAAKKPRKPRQAKAQPDTQQVSVENPASTPKSRAKVAAKKVAAKPDASAAGIEQAAPVTEPAAPASKRPRKPKPKPASDTPDMFVDEPHS